MSAELNLYLGITYTRDGVTRQYGSLETPIKTVTLTGDFADEVEYAVPASTTVDLYNYSTGKPAFTLMTVQSDGIVDLEIKTDKPTSATDKTAAGTHINHQTFQIESHAPAILSGDQGRVDVNATAKNVSSLAASTQGNVYQVRVRNNGTVTRKVTVRVFN